MSKESSQDLGLFSAHNDGPSPTHQLPATSSRSFNTHDNLWARNSSTSGNNSVASNLSSVASDQHNDPAGDADPYKDNDNDYLEFKIKNGSEEGIMRFGDSNNEQSKVVPQVIRYSLSDSNRPSPLASPFSIDSFSHHTPQIVSRLSSTSNPSVSSVSSHTRSYNHTPSVAKIASPSTSYFDIRSPTRSSLDAPISFAPPAVSKDLGNDETPKLAQGMWSPRQEHLNRLTRKQQLEQAPVLQVNDSATAANVSTPASNDISSPDFNTHLSPDTNLDASTTANPNSTTPISPATNSLNSSSQLDTPAQLAKGGKTHQISDSLNSNLLNTPGSHLSRQTDSDDELDWQEMPTVASYDVYNDKGKKVVTRKEDHLAEFNKLKTYEDELKAGASYGYTRVTRDDDEKSVDSMDGNTDYLFDEDEFKRNPLSQLEATKKMLTDSQRIAYVGLCKLAMMDMATDLAQLCGSWRIARKLSDAQNSLAKWAQMMTSRLYMHMDINPDEQKMMDLLSRHGIEAGDLAPSLLKTAKVQNPFADPESAGSEAMERDGSNTSEASASSEHTSTNNVDDLHYESFEKYRNESTIEIDIRWTILCDLFLVLISDSIYDARSRALLMHVGKYLNISRIEVCQFEKKVAEALEIDEASNQTWRETGILEERRKKALKKKYIYVGLATIGGGLVLGLSAGLLAPVIGAGIAAGLSTIGISGTAGFLAGAGGTAVVTTTGVAVGSKIGLQGMNKRMGHVKTFEFRPLHNNRRVNLVVTVSGWLIGKEDDIRLPFSTVDPVMGDLYSLLWEPEMLKSMGQTINILATEILTQSVQQVLGSTILTALMASIQLPMALSKLGYLLDNPWNVSLDRAWSSGLILADTLIRRNLGVRPVTLIGFSLGARVIYSCLVELARQGAFGLVQDVIIFGAPIVVKKDQFILARSVVGGRFVNGYSKKDWILGYLFRATSGGLGTIAGLAEVKKIDRVESLDCTEYVEGHMGYRIAMPILLRRLGWEVSSEEFEEIENPDPEQQRERQRQLIEEFDVAKRQMEKEILQGKRKKKGSLFKWLKPKEKELWEMYDRDLEVTHKQERAARKKKEEEERCKRGDGSRTGTGTSTGTRTGTGVNTPKAGGESTMFDVDAIRMELEKLAKEDLKLGKEQETFDFSRDEVPTEEKKGESIEMEFDALFMDDEYERSGGNRVGDVAPNQSPSLTKPPPIQSNTSSSSNQLPNQTFNSPKQALATAPADPPPKQDRIEMTFE